MSWYYIYCNFYQRPRGTDRGMVVTSVRLMDNVYDPIETLHRIATEPESNHKVMWLVHREAGRLFFPGQRLPSFDVVMEPDGLQGHVATGFGQIVARFQIENRPRDQAFPWQPAEARG